jgi:hypothetical protein
MPSRLGPRTAAERYGGTVPAENVEDVEGNETQFARLAGKALAGQLGIKRKQGCRLMPSRFAPSSRDAPLTASGAGGEDPPTRSTCPRVRRAGTG